MDPDEPRGGSRRPGSDPAEPVGERVVLPVIHKHWIVLFRGLALPVVVGGALLVLVVPHGGGGALVALVLMGMALAAWWVWFSWVVTTVTVTDERVTIKEGVIVRRTKLIPLDRVQDVSTRQNLFGQLLGYGCVEIDTAGAIQNEVVTHLPEPQWLREQVFVLADRFWRRTNGL